VRGFPRFGAALVTGLIACMATPRLHAGTTAPATTAPATGAPPTAAPTVAVAAGANDPAVWQEHRYSFVYMGFTSTYSCDGLADKLKLLLIAAGARGDAKVSPGACPSGFGQPDKFARAELTFHTLVPGALTTGTAPGAWRPVSIAAYHPRELRAGDCELVEQFQTNVLPLFAARNVESHTTCVPHQESGSQIDLKFETFAALPQAGTMRK
jgi:hypothetical protein